MHGVCRGRAVVHRPCDMLDMHLEHFVPFGRKRGGLQRAGRLLPRRVRLPVRSLHISIDVTETVGIYNVTQRGQIIYRQIIYGYII